MAETFETECVVIGAGAVGLACAAELARRGHEPLVLERCAGIGEGVSSRNSEVVHAGIYYPTGSLKHLLCIEGRRRLYAYLKSRNVFHRVCGKWIVATSDAEEREIAAILKRSEKNGVEGMRALSGAEARALEPNLACVAAIESRETGIFDSHGYMLALVADIEAGGGAVAFETPVVRTELLSDGRFLIETGGADATHLICKRLINSAGLYAHTIARALAGYDFDHAPPFKLAKGNYFGCAGKPAFSRLIYPAPVDGGLGVHLTLDLAGRMRFGPDVEWLSFNDPDAVDYSVDPKRSEKFYAAIRRYWPGLPDGALTPDYAGCRPKLSASGEPAADFRIDGPSVHGVEGLVHLFGIESPGLTASMAVAIRAADAVLGRDMANTPASRRAILFDRDGTLNRDAEAGYEVKNLEWRPGAIAAVRAANQAGWLAIVVTNQSGIGRGYYDEADMQAFHARMQSELAAAGAHIDAFYHCPYHPDAVVERYRAADHPDRKPNPGMLLRAMREFGVDPSISIMVGDQESDLAAARAAGVRGVLYQGGDLREIIAREMAFV